MRRRRFVKNAGLFIPAAMITGNLMAKNSEKTASGSVIIVGAGAAGLYAASVLKAAGVNITILEASERHGGRIEALLGFGDFPIEIGAEEVHGKGNTTGTPPSFLWSTINDYDPSLLLSYDSMKEIYAYGTSYVTDPPYWDANLDAAWTFFNTMYLYTGPDTLMSDYLASTYSIVEGDESWYLYEAWIGAEWGSSIKDYGMMSMAVSENLWLTGDKNFALDTSYLDLLETLFFEPVLSDIIYNSPVDSIDYSTETIVVHCANGIEYTADKVLITVPLSILKDGDIAFIPALPSEKITAINTIGMGKGMKIILKFSTNFWPDDVYDITFKSYTTEAWAPGAIKTGATNNILTCFIMGERAEYLSGLGTGAVDVVLAEMDAIFDGAASANFVDAFIHDWIKEPYIRGSYSYPAPDTYISETDSMRLTLAAPVDCKLFFAGEATNNNHPATVHGALETGARAADEIIACLPTTVVSEEPVFADYITMQWTGNTAHFDLDLFTAQQVILSLLSIDGKKITEFKNVPLNAGKYHFEFQVADIPSGIYLLETITGDRIYSKKIIVG